MYTSIANLYTPEAIAQAPRSRVIDVHFEEEMVTVCWKDGDELTLLMNPPHEHYIPANTAARYNAYLERVHSGEAKTKGKFIMGL